MRRFLHTFGLVCLLIAIFSTAAPAQEKTSANDPRLEKWLKRFPDADANGDGVLTAQEAIAYRARMQGEGGEAAKGKKAGSPRIAPTQANVKYGPHERNVFDFWKAESAEPTALVVFIHGGGFISGDKAKASPEAIRQCLDAGVSFMAINYRFREHAALQDILRDAARAIQFVRHNAAEYNIDPKRIACYGGSAGAGTSLWLATHDDLADPANADPVLRQSSRIAAAGCQSGQATYDFTKWDAVVGPFKDEWLRSPNERVEIYRFKSKEDFDTPEGKKVLADCDMLGLITSDDAPIYMSCNVPNVEPTNRGQYVHHPRHALAVKEKCDAAGVECVTVLGDKAGEKDAPRESVIDFLLRHLSAQAKAK
ncbi:MAG: alpha/beta hydrolase [Planctomycetota bacterium]